MDINTDDAKPTPKYWMSLEQWRNDPDFTKMAEKEFRTSPLQSEDGNDGWARREFLTLMGASLALTTFGCVRRPAQKIIPYAKKPLDVVHGIPNYYASSYVDGHEGLGLLVTTRDGRPTKVEGNPDHPANRGGMSARAHGHILKLYDPDRYTSAKHNLQNEKHTNRETVSVSWEDLDKAVIEQLKKGKVAVMMSTSLSPSTAALVEDFSSATGAKTYQYDEVSYSALSDGQKTSYGLEVVPRFAVDQAKYIVAINNDFLGTWLTPVTFQRQFMGRRKGPTAEMNKLVVFESLLTLTGSNADQRFRIRPSQSLDVIMALLKEIVVVRKQSRYSSDDGVMRTLSGFSKGEAELGVNVAEVAEELWKNRGQSLVMAGGLGSADSAAVQVAANFLNSVLENDGKTVLGNGPSLTSATKNNKLDLGDLMTALNGKQINTLIIHGCNPGYSMPPSAKFSEALRGVEMVIYTGDRADETAKFADYVATDHHSMENWGDMQSHAGVVSIQQPTIRPLYDTRAFQDGLLIWARAMGKGPARVKSSESWYDYLRVHWKDSILPKAGKAFDDAWVDLLQLGVTEAHAGTASPRSVASGSLSSVKPIARKTGFELFLYPTVGLGDGSLANVSWLQEFPDPVSKICWDNYASFSPKDAKQLKLKEGQYVKLTVGEQSLEAPAHIQPGQADGVVGLAIGYGRKGAGKVADGVGVNAYTLSQWKDGQRLTEGLATEVTLLSRKNDFACTQDHHSMEGRQIVVEETLQDYVKKPGGSVHRHNLTSMWSGHEYKGHKWGMVIDLNTCTGCGACVIACQSENNIPTVGKQNVINGREMHWIRVDRYYTGSPEDPGVVNQPLPCMQCDNAPCEAVCPVAATVHSDEGTNDMIYNRCVGTRYCSNNCPYKVRRFNWFNYTGIQEPKNMAMNPEVTQRFRGVMEKCSFCIHRIKFTKYQAKLADRDLKDGDVVTACQQSCPTSAIVFGDLNNVESRVRKQFDAPQSYTLLEELNTKPAVRYQVKVRNVAELKVEKPHHGESKEFGEGHHI